MANPSPVPLDRDVKNGRKTFSRSASGIPGPLSSTDTRHERWARSTLPLMAMEGVRPTASQASAALRSRFPNTCRRRISSPSISTNSPATSIANPFDVRAVLRRQGVRVEQPAVAVYRRQAVPELVRDAGRELSQAGKGFLQSKLVLELDHVREIGEEADRAARKSLSRER